MQRFFKRKAEEVFQFSFLMEMYSESRIWSQSQKVRKTEKIEPFAVKLTVTKNLNHEQLVKNLLYVAKFELFVFYQIGVVSYKVDMKCKKSNFWETYFDVSCFSPN